MTCPANIKQVLGMQREAARAGTEHQGWVARWWSGLLPEDRRTLMALAGLDDSIENARRPWLQYMQADRDAVVSKAKQIWRLVDPVKWA